MQVATIWTMSVLSDSHWPQELQRLARGRVSDGDESTKLWQLLWRALSIYARLHASRNGYLDSDDLHDLVAEKSLELLRRVDTSRWKPYDDHPSRVKAFLSTIARNGVIDLLRAQGRLLHLVEDEEWDREMAPAADDSGRSSEQREFVAALVDCVSRLPDAWQSAWWLRVLFEWPSKRIARHPDVNTNAAHLDVVLGRCRQRVRGCMRSKGLDLAQLPPGTFALLWEQWKGRVSPDLERESHG